MPRLWNPGATYSNVKGQNVVFKTARKLRTIGIVHSIDLLKRLQPSRVLDHHRFVRGKSFSI